MSNLIFGEYDVTLSSADNLLGVRFSNISVEIAFDYSYQLLSWPYLSEAGTGQAQIWGLSTDIDVTVYRDPDDASAVYELVDLIFSIEGISISLEGGLLATLVDLLENLFQDEIIDEVGSYITDILGSAIEDYIEDTNSKSVAACTSNFCMDTRLATDMAVGVSTAGISEGGTFYVGNKQDLYEAPASWPDIPASVNDRKIQTIYGLNSITTYFKTLYDYNVLSDVVCSPGDAGDNETCGMSTDGFALLEPEELAVAFPEFAAAFPDQGAAVTLRTTAAPVAEILYSAVEVTWSVELAVAPYDAATATAADAAVVLSLTVQTSGDVDFALYHGEGADALVTDKGEVVTFIFDKYATDVVVAESIVGDVAATAALTAWAEDVFFAACVWGAWADGIDRYHLPFTQMDLLYYSERSIIYDPDYVAVTVNTEPNWSYISALLPRRAAHPFPKNF